jgi:AraC-like DNA-binding protein
VARTKTDRPRGILNPRAHASRIALERYEPSRDLADFVEHYWVAAWRLHDGESYPAENLPHPSVHVVFEPSGPYVQGVHRGRFVYTARGSGRVFAVKFRPGGFRRFAGGPVWRLTDARVPLDAVFGPAGAALAAEVGAAAGVVEQEIAAVERFLLERRGDDDPRRALVATLNAAIVGTPAILQVGGLVERFGMGTRALQQLFRTYVGVGPKWVIRRARIHEALERLHAGGGVDTALLAADLGYADQAHFIKDFKAMTGVTPARYNKANARE